MILTTKNLERLSKNCGFDPQKIGIAILDMLGYSTYTYNFDDSIFVYQKDGKKLIFHKSKGRTE